MFSVCNLIVLMGFIRSFGRGLFGNFGEKNVEKTSERENKNFAFECHM